jgi:hypothetical protein
MARRKVVCFLVTVFLLPLSCTELPEHTPLEEGDIAVEKMANVDSIPSAWGSLVAVTNRPDVAHVFQLWFQDQDGNVHMAVYNMPLNRLLPNAILIPQK